MKHLAIYEFNPVDWKKIIERAKIAQAERKEGTDKYPEFVFPPHSMIGANKGFTVYEGSEEQLANVANHWIGLVKYKFIPIIESYKEIELYEKRVN
jgi:hypothetical protein